MSKKTDLLLQAYHFIEELPDSFFHPEAADSPLLLRKEARGVLRLQQYLTTWALDNGRHAYELFVTSRFVPAAIIARHYAEQAAVAFGLAEKLHEANVKADPRWFEIGFGSWDSANDGAPRDKNALRMTEIFPRIETRLTGFQRDYDQLSRALFPYAGLYDEQAGDTPPVDTLGETGLKVFGNGLVVFRQSFLLLRGAWPTFRRLFAVKP